MYKRPILRVALLILAAVLSLMITVIGVEMTHMSAKGFKLGLQNGLLIAIGSVGMAGVALSAFTRAWLKENAWLGRALVCVVLSLPALDIYALIPDPGALRAMVGQAFISLLVGSVIALAISTAWSKHFNKTSLD